MSQYAFGSGNLFGIPKTDHAGQVITTPSPVLFGTLQEGSVEINYDVKELHGQKQFPVAIARTKGKITGKAKVAQLNGMLLNSVFFGQTLTEGIVSIYVDETGQAIPATPHEVTPTVPSSGTWAEDLGVIDANGSPMTRVASSPSTGQYSVNGGTYTFAAADEGNAVYINFGYTATSSTAVKSTVINAPMGSAPSFKAELQIPFEGKNLMLTLPKCISTKLTFATKNEDFMVPEFDFSAFEEGNQIMTYALTSK